MKWNPHFCPAISLSPQPTVELPTHTRTNNLCAPGTQKAKPSSQGKFETHKKAIASCFWERKDWWPPGTPKPNSWESGFGKEATTWILPFFLKQGLQRSGRADSGWNSHASPASVDAGGWPVHLLVPWAISSQLGIPFVFTKAVKNWWRKQFRW